MSTPSLSRETIVVLDFGSQYTQLILRRVREARVYAEMLPWDAPQEELDRLDPKGIILSGGPNSVYDQDAPYLTRHVLERGIPILGICYGMQLFAHQLGGRVARTTQCEYGLAEIQVDAPDAPLFQGLPTEQKVWMSHGDRIDDLPEGFIAWAHSASSPFAAIADESRRLYGLQFHPEVAHTEHGPAILENFCRRICGCQDEWTPGSFIEESIAQIRDAVGSGHVICAVSGGVDSTVVATLVQRAVGDQLTAIYVNTGLMRKNESEETMARLREQLGLDVVYADASETFLDALKGVVDPERKRVIIGNTFIDVFEDEVRRLGQVDFLAQGTLYPDVIESAISAQSAVKIKTHHNVGGLPEDMRMELIEPLRYLFKDEVREVGRALGLPDDMVNRQPFPGPGLAVRILGEVTYPRVATLQDADAIVREEIARAGLQDEIWQYFAVLTPLMSVGVMGDSRTYANVAGIRAVTSEDGMTADWARIPFDVLARMSSRIVNEVPGVNRVVYDISSKPPATIEWE